MQKIQDWLTQSWIYKEQNDQYREALATMINLLWPAAEAGNSQEKKPSYFPLPSLCSHALGIDSEDITAVNSAWVLLYMASYLMDKIEDQQTNHPVFSRFSYGAIASLATGLFFHAERILSEIEPDGTVGAAALDAVRREYHQKALEVCAGQHMDLTVKEPSYDQTWEMVDAKSGKFFALGAYLGARLATEDAQIIDTFTTVGRCLGIMIQIRNDIQGLRSDNRIENDLALGKHTLPVQYALHVLPVDERIKLVESLLEAQNNPAAEIRARKMIISAGAVVYLSLESDKQRRKAASLLDLSGLDGNLLQPLRDLLDYAGELQKTPERLKKSHRK